MRLKSFCLSFLVSCLLPCSPAWSAPLAVIQARGKLIVAVKNNLRPLGFLDEQGDLQGLEIDLARSLAEELLGDPEALILIPVTNQERLNLLLDGKVDVVIASMSVNDSRRRLVDFSPHYYLNGTGIITNNPAITDLNALRGAKIALLQQSSTIGVIRSALPEAQLVPVTSYQEAFAALEAGEVTAFAADQTVLTGWIQVYPQYHLVSTRLSGEPLAIVMPKGLQYLELRERVNEAIASWQASGWLQQRVTYWGLP